MSTQPSSDNKMFCCKKFANQRIMLLVINTPNPFLKRHPFSLRYLSGISQIPLNSETTAIVNTLCMTKQSGQIFDTFLGVSFKVENFNSWMCDILLFPLVSRNGLTRVGLNRILSLWLMRMNEEMRSDCDLPVTKKGTDNTFWNHWILKHLVLFPRGGQMQKWKQNRLIFCFFPLQMGFRLKRIRKSKILPCLLSFFCLREDEWRIGSEDGSFSTTIASIISSTRQTKNPEASFLSKICR